MTNHRKPAKARPRSGNAGFSLAEILVGLALLALLAAVLLPTVAGQILKGDAARVTQDLNAVRSGAEQFLADVHRYPGHYTDLSKVIVASSATVKDIYGNTYNDGMVSRWKGPYVTKDTLNNGVSTGFGGTIQNTFFKVTNASNAVDYLTVLIVGVSASDFDKIDEQIDGPSTSPAGRTSGQLRFVAGGGDTTKFLALPLQ